MRQLSRFERFLQKHFSFKELGWTEIGEEFQRYTLLRHPWGTVFLHRLDAPIYHADCHDHPWGFLTFILRGGYWETTDAGEFWRRPGCVLYRPATFTHNVRTVGPGWSVIFAGPKSREWGFRRCGLEAGVLDRPTPTT